MAPREDGQGIDLADEQIRHWRELARQITDSIAELATTVSDSQTVNRKTADNTAVMGTMLSQQLVGIQGQLRALDNDLQAAMQEREDAAEALKSRFSTLRSSLKGDVARLERLSKDHLEELLAAEDETFSTLEALLAAQERRYQDRHAATVELIVKAQEAAWSKVRGGFLYLAALVVVFGLIILLLR